MHGARLLALLCCAPAVVATDAAMAFTRSTGDALQTTLQLRALLERPARMLEAGAIMLADLRRTGFHNDDRLLRVANVRWHSY